MKALRIMLANGTLYGGGAEHVIGTLATHLRAAGHVVSVAVIGDGGEVQSELLAAGIDVVTHAAGGTKGFAAARRLAAAARDRDVDIIHTHDLRSLMDAGMAGIARHHRFRHVHTFHFGNYPHLPRRQLLLESLCARLPAQLVAVGEQQRGRIAEALRVPLDRITTVWNGVDSADASAFAPAGGIGAAPIIGSMSTFGPQKGLPVLLDAARRLRDEGRRFRLVLVGDGDLRPELEAQVRRDGLAEMVTFTGWRPDAVSTLLPGFDVFVQSSNWEAMSVVILEAMAAARAIVATTVGENPRVLESERTAILVPPGDAAALAAGLARVIDDADLRTSLGRQAAEHYRAEFTGEAMTRRYTELYRSVLDRQ